MSVIVTPTQTAQVLTVLCPQGLTSGALLSALQSKYPTAGWTSTILAAVTTAGVKRGRLLRGLNGGFIADPRMSFLNYKNLAYAGDCSQYPTPSDCTRGPASFHDQ